jgi:CRP/FNR family transcriptional regulator, dissimilatory nitrate respiration regulator
MRVPPDGRSLIEAPATCIGRNRPGMRGARRRYTRAMIIDALRSAEIFAGLDDGQLASLAAIVEPVTVRDGNEVFAQGDPAEAFYLVVTGCIKVFKITRDGRTTTLRHVLAGETFGESVLFHESYPSSTSAMEDSELLRVPSDAFRDLVVAEPELGLRLLASMARLLVMLNTRIEELMLPVAARLARYLLDLCAERHNPGESELVMRESLVCYLPTSKRELAARLGTVPETLSRTLHQLVRSRLISLDGARFEVLDLRGLRRLSQR